MKERLQKLLDTMNERRAVLLDEYLSSLERDTWTLEESAHAVETAGRVHDCDRHITNIVMEIQRQRSQNVEEIVPQEEVANAY